MNVRLICIYLCLHITLPAYADVAGSVEGVLEGPDGVKKVALSALQSDYQIEIFGDVANVVVKQRFFNHFEQPLNARYLFPLQQHAAVHAMTMRVGDEVIVAQIQEKKTAQKTFAAATSAGKSAALLEQHRPNMFTQQVANLMPAQTIDIEIAYSHIVPKVDGAYELVVPLIVGPRYQPAGAGVAPEVSTSEASGASPDAAFQAGEWVLETLPAQPPTVGIDLPQTFLSERVALQIHLEAAGTIHALHSYTHPLNIRDVSSTQADITLQEGRVLDNRDFVLRYQLAGEDTSAGLLSHWQPEEGGYFSLLIEPPETVAADQVLSREMVFLLDCSGSMDGLPLEASKRFMREALHALRPQDSFRIIRFSDAATEFSHRAMPATPQNVAYGLSYVQSLRGSGGTQMSSGIRQALAAPVAGERVRNVVFLTDGYIGNEHSVLALVEELRGDARLFAFGVGAGVNRYLLDELGRVGHGFTRYFDPTKDAEHMHTVVAKLVERLQTPVLTELAIDWGDLQVTDLVPRVLPDLYLGDTIRVTGRYAAPGAGTVTIAGRSRQQQAQVRTPVVLSEGVQRPAVRRIWARTMLAEMMHTFMTPVPLRPARQTNEQLQAAVTDLGLTYKLASRWTSFVAVSQQVYNTKPTDNLEGEVALPKAAGVSQLAYAPAPMTGYGAPEPGLMISLLAALLAIGGLNLRRRRLQSHNL
ncbi:MAG: VIT domain-containing protein [bacterium]